MRHAIDYIRTHRVLLFIIIPGLLLHMMMMMPSGTYMCLENNCGIYFWGIHSHDSMWHLEIISTAFQSYPFVVPTFAGSLLSGYNILMDFSIYLISLIGIPPIITLFKIIPLVWFMLYTVLAIIFAKKWKKSALFTGILLLLFYFADHFGYLLKLYHEGSISKGSQSFALQSITSLLNTQFALSLLVILGQLILIIQKKYSQKYTLIMSFLLFISMGLKFYGGVISILLAGFYLLDALIEKKRIIVVMKSGSIMVLAIIASVLIFYNPFEATQSGAIFSFLPFATVHSVIEAPDMVYLPNMVLERYFLYEHGWSPRLLFIELYSSALYLGLNYGTRVFGILYILGKIVLRKASRFELYIVSTVFIAFTLSIMLIQRGEWWNTVQFGYYGIFLSNILLAVLLYDLIRKWGRYGILLSFIIISLTIPGIIPTIYEFAKPSSIYISQAELEAMAYLKDQSEGVVFNSLESKEGYSFLDYQTSGYVTAFTGKQLYLAHLGPLNIIGVNFHDRLDRVRNYDCSMFDEVDYIYAVKQHDQLIIEKCIESISQQFVSNFDNSEVVIFSRK